MSQPISLARSVYKAIRPYRIGIPLALSVIAGLIVGVSVLVLRANSDWHLIRAIAPHLSTLVETQDRPEILRMISSISKERGVSLVLVQNGQVFATSGSPEELDKDFHWPEALFTIEHSLISSTNLITSAPIRRENGPDTKTQILIFSPLFPVLLSCIGVALAILFLGLMASQMYAAKITSAVKTALAPIERLDVAIRELLNAESGATLPPTGIRELENIRGTILETRRALSDATDRLAETKAKELVADGYRRLIHDLYTPVAALREVLKVVHDPERKFASQEEISARVVRLAEQVLNQVSAAKENLGNEPKILTQEDVRKCIAEAAEQALLASPRKDQVTIEKKLPEIPVLLPHDPDNLRRAITNLISNALRACRSLVEIELERTPSFVAIRVSDDGSGIDQDDIGLLLQGRIASKDSERPGYGLPSANHIARLHGGRLVYRRSTLGGACFEIRV